MKTAVIIYHKNIQKIYQQHWVDKCVTSIEEQTNKDFDVFELSYGDYPLSMTALLGRTLAFRKVHFYHKPMENHVYAMNFILDRVFENGYDVAANTNLDDFYHYERLSIQLDAILQGADLVSSDFVYVKENDAGYDQITYIFKMSTFDLVEQLAANHNIVAHPAVIITNGFWKKYGPYDPTTIPKEDLLLWQKALSMGAKIRIVPKVLLNYRIHDKQITAAGRP